MRVNTSFLIHFVIAAGIITAGGTESASAQNDDCARALILDQRQLDLRQTGSLALAELYRRSIANDKEWAGSVGVEIVGIPVAGDAESAEKTRENYFSSVDIDWTFERIESLATQELSDNAVEAYRICKDGEHRSGPRILIYKSNSEGATVEIRWRSAGGAATTARNARIVVDGGVFDQAFPTTWNNNEARTRFVRREAGKDVRISADIGPETDSAFLSRVPARPEKIPVLEVASCRGRGAFADFYFWGPRGESCNGLPNYQWGRYDGNPQVVTSLGKCAGQGGSVPGLEFWGPVGEPCLFSDARWGTYQAAQDVTAIGIANCAGGGEYFNGHWLWGPTGQVCVGIKAWGSYSQNRVLTNAQR